MSAHFLRQEHKPLFPNILWNRPLNRAQGGRILIIGGHKGGFNECQAIYQLAVAAGAGECQIALPDSLAKTVAPLGIGQFVAASPSGSLGKAALGELMALAADYDAIIIAGNLTNNSETTVLVESFIDKYQGPLIIGSEVLEMLKFQPHKLSERPKTLIIGDGVTIFGWANLVGVPFKAGNWDNLILKFEASKHLLEVGKAEYAIFNGQIIIPSINQPSATTLTKSLSKLPTAALGVLSVFWVQNPAKTYEGLTTGAFVLQQALLKTSQLSYSNLASQVEKAIQEL